MFSQISYWAFRDGPAGKRNPLEAMRLAKEAGFDGIELAVDTQGFLTPDTSPSECKNIVTAAKAVGIKIGSVASGLLWGANPASRSAQTRKEALEITNRCLELTAELGAKHLLILSGHVDVFFMPDAEVVPYDDCYERSLAFCKAVGKTAKKLGVTACVENVWNRFLLSPLEFRDFLKKVNNPNVGMYFDVGNVWNTGYPQHWIKMLGKLIKRVHVKDFKRAVGNANGFCQLLDGDVPLKESIKLLKRLGYNGPVTAEIMPGPNDVDEPAFLRTIADRMKQFMP